jgi:hypothetical protein
MLTSARLARLQHAHFATRSLAVLSAAVAPGQYSARLV